MNPVLFFATIKLPCDHENTHPSPSSSRQFCPKYPRPYRNALVGCYAQREKAAAARGHEPQRPAPQARPDGRHVRHRLLAVCPAATGCEAAAASADVGHLQGSIGGGVQQPELFYEAVSGGIWVLPGKMAGAEREFGTYVLKFGTYVQKRSVFYFQYCRVIFSQPKNFPS